MKKLALVFLAAVCVSSLLICKVQAVQKPAETMPFDVYTEDKAKTNHFIPSGWMGDVSAVKIRQDWKENPHSGTTSIKITYTGESKQGAGWAGIYWQNPEHNWGSKDGGFNLSGAKKLVLWARGEKGGEKVEFKMGGITGDFADTDMTSVGPLTLTTDWKEYTIDLSGLDLSYISGGLVWAASRMDNPDGTIIYLDDIQYIGDATVQPQVAVVQPTAETTTAAAK